MEPNTHIHRNGYLAISQRWFWLFGSTLLFFDSTILLLCDIVRIWEASQGKVLWQGTHTHVSIYTIILLYLRFYIAWRWGVLGRLYWRPVCLQLCNPVIRLSFCHCCHCQVFAKKINLTCHAERPRSEDLRISNRYISWFHATICHQKWGDEGSSIRKTFCEHRFLLFRWPAEASGYISMIQSHLSRSAGKREFIAFSFSFLSWETVAKGKKSHGCVALISTHGRRHMEMNNFRENSLNTIPL